MKRKVEIRKKIICAALVGMMAVVGTGCGNTAAGGSTQSVEQVKDVPLSNIVDAVKDAYKEDYIPGMEFTKEEIEEKFKIKPEWYDEIIAEGPMISINIDTFVAVKAKEGEVDKVEEALTNYRQQLIDDTMQYPTNKAKIPGSRVDTIGNYVFFSMLGVIPMEVEEKGEEAILEESKKQNLIAFEAIKGALKQDKQ